MKRVIVIAAVAALLAVPAASAHNGVHWTEAKAARVLVTEDLSRANGSRINVGDASCTGFGHNFISFNGHRVFSKFTCSVYPVRGQPMCIELATKNGLADAVWVRTAGSWCGF